MTSIEVTGDLPSTINHQPSTRETWPKTPQEKDIAITLIKQCFAMSHNYRNEIQWAVLKADHPALYDQLAYWAADDAIRIHQLAHTMRHDKLIPDILHEAADFQTTASAGAPPVASRFAPFDDFVKDHQNEFVHYDHDPNKRVDWAKTADKFPGLAIAAKAVWEKEWPSCLPNISQRFNFLKTNPLSQPAATHKPRAEARRHYPINEKFTEFDNFIRTKLDTLPRKGISKQIAWGKIAEKNPLFLSIVTALWGKDLRIVSRQAAGRIKNINRQNKKANEPKNTLALRKPSRAATAKPDKRPRVALSDLPAPNDSGDEMPPGAAGFRFEVCPNCFTHLGTAAKMLQMEIIDCPKCRFPILKAEQGIAARYAIPD